MPVGVVLCSARQELEICGVDLSKGGVKVGRGGKIPNSETRMEVKLMKDSDHTL